MRSAGIGDDGQHDDQCEVNQHEAAPRPRRRLPARQHPADQRGDAGVREHASDGFSSPIGRARRSEKCEQRRDDQRERGEPADDGLSCCEWHCTFPLSMSRRTSVKETKKRDCGDNGECGSLALTASYAVKITLAADHSNQPGAQVGQGMPEAACVSAARRNLERCARDAPRIAPAACCRRCPSCSSGPARRARRTRPL